jgi:phosphomannomutase
MEIAFVFRYNMINKLQYAFADSQLVQSFSGVRTVMGFGPDISAEHHVLAMVYGYYYAVKFLSSKPTATVLLGRDPRPTGKTLVRALGRGFLAGAAKTGTKLNLTNLGIITTPLAETAVRALKADGGVMVTASHNPIDSNGFKFLSGCEWEMPNSAPAGALLSSAMMAELIKDVANAEDISEYVNRFDPVDVDITLHDQIHDLQRVIAERAYLDGIGLDWGLTPHCLKPYTLGPVLLDPNGGAGCGIGARVLNHFGVRVIEVNAETGQPEHGIDTDGIDPANGRHMLLRVARAAARERTHFGVAFDYDADRGNMVLPGDNESAILPAQRVATFNIALILTHRLLHEKQERPLAVVVSDATSLASHRVAEAFGAKVFQVETGEINVVTKMDTLRKAGYDVPIGVEGANGGTIFASATCRDGLQVALGAAQAESTPILAKTMLEVLNKVLKHGFDPEEPVTLTELVSAVPMFQNIMSKVKSPPLAQSVIKQKLEKIFIANYWQKLSGHFDSYLFENFEGTNVGPNRSGDESGAWRILLQSPTRSAFIFLRGSRTEPGVWRTIIDASDSEDFALLQNVASELFKEGFA